MDQSDLLRCLAERLELLRLRYFVTGSIASTYFGEPRFTNDIDVVIALQPSDVTAFCDAFPSPEFYLSQDAVRQAIDNRTQFNIIHPASGLKVDVMVPEDTPFNQSRFARVTRIMPEIDYEVSFASPEDVILKKLDFYRQGRSEKHLGDIAGILKVSSRQIDHGYIAHWAKELGLDAIWSDIVNQST